MVNDKQKMARLITEERRVLTGSLHTVPDIHRLFTLHKYDWMAQDPGTYSEEMVREFYASYAATLRGSISKRSKPLAQDPLTSTLVRGCPVDISPATIRRFLYGPTAGHSWSLNIAEFDYRWDIVRSGAFQRNSEQREAVIQWLAKYIAADGERAEWVAAPRLGIRKATLTFVAKFFWLLVRNRVSPTKADNQVTWDRAVMVAALWTRVPIRIGQTSPPYSAIDIGLIRDEANVAATRREPQVELAWAPPAPAHTALGDLVFPGRVRPEARWLRCYTTFTDAKVDLESEARVERRMEDMMDLRSSSIIAWMPSN
ncbi:hypothetical protein H5410_030781 [Solanum commersonii]|uniref:Putative plant transposon protein domain-containing protein n=1 Tax=Solanum commersonii TaxID=4109 RepID=A0A9J5YF94_SOLCO|nr:hypothetical protein H5410_030781 [Solanum commersonii]